MTATEILRQCHAVERCTSELPDHIKTQQIWYVKFKTVCQNLLAQCEAQAKSTNSSGATAENDHSSNHQDPEVRIRLQEIEAARIVVEELLKGIEQIFHPELFIQDEEDSDDVQAGDNNQNEKNDDEQQFDGINEDGGVGVAEGEDSVVSPSRQQPASPSAAANANRAADASLLGSPSSRARRGSGTGRNLAKRLQKAPSKKQNDRAGLFGDYGGSSSMDYEGERSKLEDEMLDSVQVMNKMAKGMHSAIQKDLKQLEQTTDLMDKEGDSLSKQQKTGEEVYAASSFDFFRTLFFLAVSVVVYVLMMIFIVTSGMNPLNFIPVIR